VCARVCVRVCVYVRVCACTCVRMRYLCTWGRLYVLVVFGFMVECKNIHAAHKPQHGPCAHHSCMFVQTTTCEAQHTCTTHACVTYDNLVHLEEYTCPCYLRYSCKPKSNTHARVNHAIFDLCYFCKPKSNTHACVTYDAFFYKRKRQRRHSNTLFIYI